MEHLKRDHVNRSIVENVISFSANARAIQKAMDNGDALDELMIPGIAIMPEMIISCVNILDTGL